MKKIYFTITGTKYRYGQDFLKPGMNVYLQKEPDNAYDKEAIAVSLPGLSVIGYVANSVHTVKGDSYSAGRMYDLIGKSAEGKVRLVLDDGVICSLTRKKK